VSSLKDRTVVIIGGRAEAKPAAAAESLGATWQVVDSTVLYLFGNGDTTGSALCPDGGYALR
jgi:hypothetical protein